MKITASTTRKNEEGKTVKDKTVSYEADIPATLAEKVEKFGEDVVNASAEDALVIAAQAVGRRMLGKGASEEAIQAAMSSWRPDVKSVVRQTAFEKASSTLDKLSTEERKALLEKLRALG